jgi:hypothetical protein
MSDYLIETHQTSLFNPFVLIQPASSLPPEFQEYQGQPPSRSRGISYNALKTLPTRPSPNSSLFPRHVWQ